MAKRQNPFDDNYCQLKTHVGEKQVNMGVNFHIRMKSVYERTMTMLFEGQKRMLSPVVIHASSTRDTAPSPIQHNNSSVETASLPDWAQAQYTLDNHGNLSTQHPNISLPHKAGQLKTPTASCSSCKTSAASVYGTCSFCDHQICSQCCRECVSCNGVFCSFCSVINYNESFERCFCLSCPTSH